MLIGPEDERNLPILGGGGYAGSRPHTWNTSGWSQLSTTALFPFPLCLFSLVLTQAGVRLKSAGIQLLPLGMLVNR